MKQTAGCMRINRTQNIIMEGKMEIKMTKIPKDDTKRMTEREILGIADIIGVLGDDFSNIYCVDCRTKNIEIYRYENKNVGVKEVLHEKSPYESAIQGYIEKNVYSDDKEKMKSATDFDNIYNQLKHVAQFTVHYRVKRNNEILYYRMKCARIGKADDFQKIIFAFASEDADVRLNELGVMMKSSGATGKRKILIVEDDELNLEMLESLLVDKYEILTAKNGRTGLKVLEEYYKELSLILLDVQMPVLNGFEFLKKVREDALISSVPIIVITANDSVDTELICLDLGAADFITKPYNADIIRRRIRNVIRLKESSMTLEAVERDELTGLYTEQAFLHYVKQMMSFKPNKKMQLIIAKIKDFKLINSIYGMKKADEFLCYLASAYSRRLKDGLIARKGSTSFVCLFYGDDELNHSELADTIAEIAKNAPIKGVKVKYGIYENIDKSLPVSTVCDYASLTAEAIMESYECDVAFYTEKQAKMRIYEQMIENDFEKALNNQEFLVYYQPKVDLVTEKVIGAEALVRWKKPDGTMVSPGEFIPVYEKNGQIEKLDEYVFQKVCQLQKRKLDEREKLLSISVNLSRSSILRDGIAERYIKIAEENEIPISCVPLELTESAAIYGKRIHGTTEQLVNAGFKLHMDDFGSGYSSMICLNQLPFSTLKIDKSLVDHICEPKGKTLVEQIIMLSKLLNMEVVAEGVENIEQIEELRKMKCDVIQGFYYAKPMSENEFIEYVKVNRLR